MNQAILESINVLESILDPTFYHYQIFLNSLPSSNNNHKEAHHHHNDITDYPLFWFISSLIYLLLTRPDDYYIDKSFVVGNPILSEQELYKTNICIKDPALLETTTQLLENIKLVKSKTCGHEEIILRENWPNESKIIKLVRINPQINKILPLKRLNAKITKTLSRLEKTYGKEQMLIEVNGKCWKFEELISHAYEEVLGLLTDERSRGKKRALAELSHDHLPGSHRFQAAQKHAQRNQENRIVYKKLKK